MATASQRSYTLIIGRPVYIGSKPTKISDNVDTNTQDSAFRITNPLNMEFEIRKDNSADANKGYVSINNLSDETVNYLDANQRENVAVILTAGYNGDEQQIFSGTIEFMEDNWEGPTRTTKFIFGDATLNLSSSKSSRSYRKGTPLANVVKDLASDLKLPMGRSVGIEGTLQRSMAFSGNTSDNLRNLAKNTGSTFSVQDGAVYWTKEGSRFKDVVFEISEETGMVESPVPVNPEPRKRRLEKKAKKKKPSKPKKDAAPKAPSGAEVREDAGLKVSTKLNGAIIPESTIYLKSKKYTGFYKVISLTHKGTWKSGDWDTELWLSETRGKLIE